MFCVSCLNVNHSFEPSCFSFVFHFVFLTRRTSDDAPRVLVAASGPGRPPPPSHPPECGIVREDEGSVTPDLSSMRVAVDMTRCTQMPQHEIVRRRQMVEE